MSRRGRVLVSCCAAFVVAAVALWVSSGSTWYRTTAEVPMRGPVPVSFTGGQVWPALFGLAPVALAGVAAVLGLAGLPRRLVGGLVAALGLWAVVLAIRTLFGSVLTPLDPGYPTPPSGVSLDALRDHPLEATGSPWIAVAGGLAMFVGGLWVLTREPWLPRLGSRFSIGHDRPRRPDQDRDWWTALDEGRDPTATTGSGTDPQPSG